MKIASWSQVLLDAIFPPRCVACNIHIPRNGTLRRALCTICEETIAINTAFFCSECKKRNPENKKTCHKNALFILGATSMYGNPATRALIHGLKYQNIRSALPSIEKMLKAYLDKTLALIPKEEYAIVPVPLHKRKEMMRGFNQAELIAKILEKYLLAHDYPVTYADFLKRGKSTKPQAELETFKEREINLAEAFFVENLEKIKNRRIILVDDVFTSGATMREAVRVLRRAGAKQIIGFVVALA